MATPEEIAKIEESNIEQGRMWVSSGHAPPFHPRNNPMIAANWVRDDPDIPSPAEQRMTRERAFMEQMQQLAPQ